RIGAARAGRYRLGGPARRRRAGPAQRRARLRRGRRAGRGRDTGGPGRPQPAPGGRVPRADRRGAGRHGRDGGGPMTAAEGPASAPGSARGRPLPWRVETIRQLRRRRTMVAALILLVLPWVLVGAFELGGPPQTGGSAPGLVDLATTGGLNFAAFSFF